MFYCIFVSLAAGCFHSFSLPFFFLSVIWRECEELEKKRETERELRDPTAIKALPFCAIYVFLFLFIFFFFVQFFSFIFSFLLALSASFDLFNAIDDSNDATCVRSKSDCVRVQGFCCVSFVCVCSFHFFLCSAIYTFR